MRQIVLSGLGDHVAHKVSTQGMNAEDRKRLRYAYEVRRGEGGREGSGGRVEINSLFFVDFIPSSKFIHGLKVWSYVAFGLILKSSLKFNHQN